MQVGAPKELLQNQEASLLRDIRDAINKRIKNRISTARRFAVSILILKKISWNWFLFPWNQFHDIFVHYIFSVKSISRNFCLLFWHVQVRVRNHAKMVDVYLATFNSKKGLLGNAKSVAEDIIQNPQNYHIYDGISTMTNISR